MELFYEGVRLKASKGLTKPYWPNSFFYHRPIQFLLRFKLIAIMKILNLTIQHLVVITVCIILFYIDDKELFLVFTRKVILIVIVLSKFFYFLSHNLRLINKADSNQNFYRKFLLSISVNISLIIVSFGVDYFCLYQIDAMSFNGIPIAAPLFEKVCTFIYFSVSTFSTTGFGDIQSLTLTGRFLITLEIIMAFITTVFIISNFVNLKSISTDNKN